MIHKHNHKLHIIKGNLTLRMVIKKDANGNNKTTPK